MCGIVGYVGERSSVPILIEGLERLEYRGYDSAGIAVETGNGLSVVKTKGKVAALRAMDLPAADLGTGIGHTRWATHGEPSDVNAHPHTDGSGRIAVVHNGIIENATSIRERLEEQGAKFASDTDSEVIAHLDRHRGDRRPGPRRPQSARRRRRDVRDRGHRPGAARVHRRRPQRESGRPRPR